MFPDQDQRAERYKNLRQKEGKNTEKMGSLARDILLQPNNHAATSSWPGHLGADAFFPQRDRARFD